MLSAKRDEGVERALLVALPVLAFECPGLDDLTVPTLVLQMKLRFVFRTDAGLAGPVAHEVLETLSDTSQLVTQIRALCDMLHYGGGDILNSVESRGARGGRDSWYKYVDKNPSNRELMVPVPRTNILCPHATDPVGLDPRVP